MDQSVVSKTCLDISIFQETHFLKKGTKTEMLQLKKVRPTDHTGGGIGIRSTQKALNAKILLN